jgi:putative oxidoreductase
LPPGKTSNRSANDLTGIAAQASKSRQTIMAGTVGSSSAQDVAALVGRVLMSALFVWSGFGKLTAAAETDAYFTSLGLPFPDLVRLFAVAAELGGGLAVLLGFQARLAAAGLAIWCLATAAAGHSNFADVGTQIHFMKNVAMTGGFVLIAAFGPGAYALAEWPRSRLTIPAQ